MDVLDEDHVWIAGDRGTILFFDGSSFTAQVTATTASLYAVRALDRYLEARAQLAVRDPKAVFLNRHGTRLSSRSVRRKRRNGARWTGTPAAAHNRVNGPSGAQSRGAIRSRGRAHNNS